MTGLTAIGRKFIRLLAQGFGSGLSPYAPGTAGTLLAVLIYLCMRPLGNLVYSVILVCCFLVGIFICDRVSVELGERDHPSIVWDEMVGFWMVMLVIPDGWYWIPIGFLLFRLFDIVKPWPISWIDRHVAGGLGIMLDDLAAAAVSWVLLQLCNQAILQAV